MIRDLSRRLRGGLAAALAGAGAVALFLGWWGVSGTAFTAKQVPYLVSGGLTGVALITLAAAVFAGDDLRRSIRRLEALEGKVSQLLELLTEEGAGNTGPAFELHRVPDESGPVAVAGGSSYHRASCRLVLGKSTVRPVDPADPTDGALAPCRICRPPALDAA